MAKGVKGWKKYLALLLAVALLAPVTAWANYAPPFQPRSRGVYLENVDTGMLIYEENGDQRLEAGYLAKLMTALMTVEYMEEKGLDLDAEKVPLKLYIQNLVYGSANLGGILLGEEVSVRGLLYAMLLQSANEATMMLGDYIGDGSVGHFADMMNDRARELGCTGTEFADPAGFHDDDPAQNSWTTPRDMGIIFKAVMENDILRQILQTRDYDIGPTNKHDSLNQFNYTNALMSTSSDYYYGPVDGGFISVVSGQDAGIAVMASTGGYSYLLVLLGTPGGETLADTRATLYTEAKDLLQWAFDSFAVRTVMEKGEIMEEVEVKYSFLTDHMPVATSETFMTLMPNGVDLTSIQMKYDLPEAIAAPVEKGLEIGRLHLILADEEIGSVPLMTTDYVEASKFLTWMGWLEASVHTFWFKFCVLFVLSFVVLYTSLLVQVNKRKRRQGRYSRYHSQGGRYL